MSSLDVLDYATALEEALARQGMPGPLRGPAVREARRTIEALAFRFALLDERALPEDLDHLRALEAMKPPERAAQVLMGRRPIYAANRRRRLVTTWTVLALLALAIGGFWYAVTGETADTVAAINDRVEAGGYREVNFTVDGNVTRLYVAATVVVPKTSEAGIRILLIDPSGRQRLDAPDNSFAPGGNNYLGQSVEAPAPGAWTLRVLYEGAGSAQVEVQAIRPTR